MISNDPNTRTTQLMQFAWDAGFRHTVPLIPVGGALFPGGTASDGSAIPPCEVPENQMGKVPGLFRNGYWTTAWEWNTNYTTEHSVTYYDQAGANVGLMTGEHWVGLDVDVGDDTLAMAMRNELKMLGINAPIRVGNHPKFLVLFRIAEGEVIRRRQYPLINETRGEAVRTQIEVMGLSSKDTPTQVVILGSHPSGRRYQWDAPWGEHIFQPGGAANVPTITEERLNDLITHLFAVARDRGWKPGREVTSGGDAQSSELGVLPSDPGLVQQVMDMMPNGEDVLWDDWVRVGLSVKAALGDAGFEMWDAWSKKSKLYDVGDNTVKRWNSFRPDGRTGFGTLVHQLRTSLGGLPAQLENAIRAGVKMSQFDLMIQKMPLDPGPLPVGAEPPTVLQPAPPQHYEYKHGTNGQLITNAHNVFVALMTDVRWNGVFAYNEFTEKLRVLRPVPSFEYMGGDRDMTDTDYIRVQTWMQLHFFPRLSKADAIAGVELASIANKYDPLVEYLDKLPESPGGLLNSWLFRFLGVEQKDPLHDMYVAQVGRKWLISAVARALDPGCKADHVLILEGEQGVGKSSALQALCPVEEWFGDGLPNFTTKDASSYLNGKWIVEMAELTTVWKSEIEDMRKFITRQVENYRPSYGRTEITKPRRSILAGSTNRDDYVKDIAGERRFWIVRCGEVDLKGLTAIRDQLWREAVDAYRAGEVWHLEGEIAKFATRQQQDRLEDDPVIFDVSERIGGMEELCIPQLLEMMGVPSDADQKARRRYATALLRNGFQRDGQISGGRYRGQRRFRKV